MLPTGSLRAGEDEVTISPPLKKSSESKMKARALKLQKLLIYTVHLPAVLFPLRRGISL